MPHRAFGRFMRLFRQKFAHSQTRTSPFSSATHATLHCTSSALDRSGRCVSALVIERSEAPHSVPSMYPRDLLPKFAVHGAEGFSHERDIDSLRFSCAALIATVGLDAAVSRRFRHIRHACQSRTTKYHLRHQLLMMHSNAPHERRGPSYCTWLASPTRLGPPGRKTCHCVNSPPSLRTPRLASESLSFRKLPAICTCRRACAGERGR
jgi:hypothetical protein